jgi:hypothetical protein
VLTGNGTGAITANAVTNGAVLLGGASNAVTDTGVLSKGVLLVGDGSGAPTLLTVGANDTALTADSAEASGVKWAALAAGGTYELISTVTLAGDTVVDFTDLTSDYSAYEFVFAYVQGSVDGRSIAYRVSSDNGSTFETTGYTIKMISVETGGLIGSANTSAFGYGQFNNYNIGNATNENACCTVTVISPLDSAPTTLLHQEIYTTNVSSRRATTIGINVYTPSTSINAIRIFMRSSGNLQSGTIVLYGIKAA